MHGDRKRAVSLGRRGVRLPICLLVLCAFSVPLVACGSSGSDSTNSGSTSTEGGGGSTGESVASESSSQKEAAEYAAQFIGKPTPFPASKPLKEPAPEGLKFAYMDCGTTVCGLIKAIAEPAVAGIGGKFIDVKAGTSAASATSAFNSALALEPDVILNGGIDPALWRPALEKIKDEGIPVTSTGVVETSNYGLEEYPNTNLFGRNAAERSGKIQANYAYSLYGDGSTFLVPDLPAIAATTVVSGTFKEEIENLCPDCTVNLLTMQPEELGATGPAKIVSALQAAPDTVAVIPSSDGISEGLPTALKNAGLDQEIIGTNATPNTLNYIKAGQEKASVALDFGVMVWGMIDAGLRAVEGEPVPKLEAEGLPVIQLLTQPDITFDTSKGFVGYPDFAERYMKMWEGK
jgi:ribose transport system substrate-binding protein